jgi:protein-tyrosine phosphatase
MASPAIPGTFNSRDLGGLRAAGGVVQAGLLIRSEVPVSLGDAGQAAVRALGVRTAVDLREPIERKRDAPDFDGAAVEVREVPIIGDDFDAGVDVSLEEIYLRLLSERGPQLTGAVRALSAPEALPAIVFCSAGKDRTGLVIALVLAALGVPEDQIVADYARTSDAMNGPFLAAIEERAIAAGISEQELAVKVGAPPELMRTVLAQLRERDGGAAGYLRRYGLSEAELATLRRSLIAPSDA